MYGLKRFILLTFTVLIILSSTINISAENYASGNYTSLGDSIAYGLSSSQGNGYVDLFYNYLKSLNENTKMNKYNLGTPGDTSSNLLTKLQSDADTQKAVKNAKVITISVGGNNILSPIIAVACKVFQVDPKSETLAKDLGNKIKATPKDDLMIMSLINSLELQNALISGVSQFCSDWPQIITSIKGLSPTAHIYAMTIYDPVSAIDPLSIVFEQLLLPMNRMINSGAQNKSYNVVDVYSTFKTYNGKEPLVNFSLSKGNADPHPTDKGHAAIFQTYLSSAKVLETSAPAPLVKKEASITSSKYKVDKIKSTISILQKQVPLNIFKSNIKVSKGAAFIIIKPDGKTTLISGNIVPGMKIKVTAEDKKTQKLYSIIK